MALLNVCILLWYLESTFLLNNEMFCTVFSILVCFFRIHFINHMFRCKWILLVWETKDSKFRHIFPATADGDHEENASLEVWNRRQISNSSNCIECSNVFHERTLLICLCFDHRGFILYNKQNQWFSRQIWIFLH